MAESTLRVGTQGPIFPPYDNVVKTLKKLDEVYDSVWWPDHLMGWIPDCLWKPDLIEVSKFQRSPHTFLETFTIMAAAACNTSNILLGSAVTEPFRRHPAEIAQAFLTLDHISKGRVILGIGAGEGENIVPYGLRWESPARRLRESIEVIRLLWSGRRVDYNGRIWRLKDAILSLPPEREGRYPPIWVGAHSNMTLETTGRLADGWLPEHLDVDEYSEKLRKVADAAKRAGRDPECVTPALMTSLVISEDHEDCHRMLNSVAAKAYALLTPFQKYEAHGYEHPLGKLNAYKEYIPTRVSEAEILSAIGKVPQEICENRYIHGTPEEVVDKIEDYVRIGLRHIVLWNLTPLCDYSKTKESFSALLKVVQYFKD
ncbi:MAG: LLM class flavin-dependent oxidoreductase, partial [Candidatus Bathyarchaeia archaeon]